MKSIFNLALLLTGFAATAAPTPNERVLKAFNETFSTAVNVTWEEFDHNSQANFKLNDIKIKALYDGEGNLVETIRYYTEEILPPNIVAKLKKRYAGKEIYSVTEVSSENELSYYISLKDQKNWYIVKSDPLGYIVQTDKFRNAGE
jgi:hypothetical protein